MTASLQKQDETLERRQRVSELYRQGYSNGEIALKVGKSRPTITNDLKVIRSIWLQRIADNYDEMQSEELAKIDRVERIANEQWEKTEEKDLDATKKFSDIVLSCIRQRVDILGLDDPAKFGQRAIISGKDKVMGVVEVTVETREQVKAVLSYQEFQEAVNGKGANGKAG